MCEYCRNVLEKCTSAALNLMEKSDALDTVEKFDNIKNLFDFLCNLHRECILLKHFDISYCDQNGNCVECVGIFAEKFVMCFQVKGKKEKISDFYSLLTSTLYECREFFNSISNEKFV